MTNIKILCFHCNNGTMAYPKVLLNALSKVHIARDPILSTICKLGNCPTQNVPERWIQCKMMRMTVDT